MQVKCISDLHGFLPPIEKCDLFLIAGDVTPVENHDLGFQAYWLETIFKKWIEEIPAKQIVMVFGNHDLIGEKYPKDVKEIFNKFPKNFAYLQDSIIEFEGLKIFGSPWQNPFGYGWAFNKSDKQVKKHYDECLSADIIINHGPPFGYGDKVLDRNEHTGSKELLNLIDRVKPKLFCCGHIHCGYGIYSHNDSILVNASIMNEDYQPVNNIVEINL